MSELLNPAGCTCILAGSPSSRPQVAASRSWHPKSPKAPNPNSQKSRQVTGAYNSLKGLFDLGPTQRSQFSPFGIGDAEVGISFKLFVHLVAGTQE